MKRLVTALAIGTLLVGWLSGCGATAPASDGQSSPAATPAGVATAPGAAEPTATAPALSPTVLGGANLDVPPDLVAGAVADLAGRLGVAPDGITVVSAEAVSWPDGALGCPQPGMMYPQVITEGYRVILAVDSTEYAYHGGTQGELFYCENPAP